MRDDILFIFVVVFVIVLLVVTLIESMSYPQEKVYSESEVAEILGIVYSPYEGGGKCGGIVRRSHRKL